MIEARDWKGLDAYIARGQNLFLRMKYTSYPVVAAAHGLALGGGCEFMLNANAIVAHADLKAGLPETKVGLIPGWGGGTQLLQRAAQSREGPDASLAAAAAVFALISGAAVSSSALDARNLGVLVGSDRVVMDREHLLFEARARALELAEAYVVPERARLTVTGSAGYRSLMDPLHARHDTGEATDADVAIGEVLATALTGGRRRSCGSDPGGRDDAAGARGLHRAREASRDGRAHPSHVDDRQAAAQLTARGAPRLCLTLKSAFSLRSAPARGARTRSPAVRHRPRCWRSHFRPSHAMRCPRR